MRRLRRHTQYSSADCPARASAVSAAPVGRHSWETIAAGHATYAFRLLLRRSFDRRSALWAAAAPINTGRSVAFLTDRDAAPPAGTREEPQIQRLAIGG